MLILQAFDMFSSYLSYFRCNCNHKNAVCKADIIMIISYPSLSFPDRLDAELFRSFLLMMINYEHHKPYFVKPPMLRSRALRCGSADIRAALCPFPARNRPWTVLSGTSTGQ